MGVDTHNRQGVSDDQIDLRELSRMLFRQRWPFLGVFFAVFLVTIFVTLRMPKIYEAYTTLEYDPTPPSPLGSEVEDVASTSGSFLAGKEWYQTQNAIIESQTIARRVVEKLGLHRSPEFMEVASEEQRGWAGVDIDVAAEKLRSQLTVRQQRETRVVRVSVEDTDAERAALLANAFADNYMDWMMEQRLGSTVRAVEWLSGQLDDISKRLAASERGLYEFRRENNVLSVSLEDQQNNVTQTINRFSAALADTTTRRIDVEAKLRQLESALRDDPMRVRVGLVDESPAVAAVRRQFYDAQVTLDKLSVSYGPNHPEVRKVKIQVEGLVKAARDEIQGMLEVVKSKLREVKDVEQGLKLAKQRAQNVGLDLSLREIDYRRLQRESENNAKLHNLLLQRTAETSLTKMLRVSPVRLVDRAMQPHEPIRPKTALNLAVGCIVGLLGGIGLAAFRVRMDRSVGIPDDIIRLGETLLGIVPGIVDRGGTVSQTSYSRRRVVRRIRERPQAKVSRDLVVHHFPRSAAAECCRTIRTNLAFMTTETPLKALVVTSPGPAEGKSTLAVSLAITMANSGRNVLLIDSDLRRPRIHRAFGLHAEAGITSILLGEQTVAECVHTTMVNGLSLLPCGPIPPNPAELLHTARFGKMLADLKQQYDIIILDSPPVGVVIDAAIIGPQVDGAIVVAESGSTALDAMSQALRQMRDVGTKILGCVLNNVDLAKETGYGGYYYYRPGYYNERHEDPSNDDTNSGGEDPKVEPTTSAPV